MTDRAEPLDDCELRLEALRAALQVTRDPKTALAIAGLFADFVFGYVPEEGDGESGAAPADQPEPALTPEQRRTGLQIIAGREPP